MAGVLVVRMFLAESVQGAVEQLPGSWILRTNDLISGHLEYFYGAGHLLAAHVILHTPLRGLEILLGGAIPNVWKRGVVPPPVVGANERR